MFFWWLTTLPLPHKQNRKGGGAVAVVLKGDYRQLWPLTMVIRYNLFLNQMTQSSSRHLSGALQIQISLEFAVDYTFPRL